MRLGEQLKFKTLSESAPWPAIIEHRRDQMSTLRNFALISSIRRADAAINSFMNLGLSSDLKTVRWASARTCVYQIFAKTTPRR